MTLSEERLRSLVAILAAAAPDADSAWDELKALGRTEAIPHLQPLLAHSDQRTVEDAAAATAALVSQNHHRFVDRSNSGRAFWVVNPGDRQD